MNIVFNAEAKQWEANTTGKLVEILEDERTNSNETPYRIVVTEITYADGSKDEITASLWSASLDKHADKFVPGAKVGVAINVDPNSEYQGNAKISLPGGRADVAKLLTGMKLPEGMVATKQVAEKA